MYWYMEVGVNNILTAQLTDADRTALHNMASRLEALIRPVEAHNADARKYNDEVVHPLNRRLAEMLDRFEALLPKLEALVGEA